MTAQEFIQYRQQVSALALRGLSTETPGGTIALAVPAGRLLLADDPALHAALADGLHALAAAGPRPRFTDPAGHHRDVYDPLVLHLHLAAFARRYESLPASLWSRCQSALADATVGARAIERFAGVAPPESETALALWQALCVAEAGSLESRDVDMELADGLVHDIVARPGPDGSLHPRGPDVSLDAWTYREMAGLHALANLALLRRSGPWARRVEEIARHHLENTQPDHTTSQPWGLFAFLWSDSTRSFAQQQLHDVAAQGSGVPGLVASLLLADTADALGRFGR